MDRPWIPEARPHAIKALSIFSHGSPYVPHLRGRHREPRSHVFYDSARRWSRAPATIRVPRPVPTLCDPFATRALSLHFLSKRYHVNSLFTMLMILRFSIGQLFSFNIDSLRHRYSTSTFSVFEENNFKNSMIFRSWVNTVCVWYLLLAMLL